MSRAPGGRGRQRRLPPPRGRIRSDLLRPSLLRPALALALIACRPTPSETPEVEAAAVELAPPPTVDHGEAPPYAGTWAGPKLRLSFVGPWVLVEPVGGEADQVPIELRVEVERAEGQAFALRTSVAGRWPADFLRPTDWTMLVEDGELALAMGDEPLEAYVAVDPRNRARAPALLGPAMLDELDLPEQLPFAEASACLELASLSCAGFEAEGPRVAGCREALWGACVEQLASAGVDGLESPPLLVRSELVALRFALGLRRAPGEDGREARELFFARVEAGAHATLAELEAAGRLPKEHPSTRRLQAWLAEPSASDG